MRDNAFQSVAQEPINIPPFEYSVREVKVPRSSMTRIKVSVNDANGITQKNAERANYLALIAGAKPVGDWKASKDSSRGVSTSYYAESLEREYEFDGQLAELKLFLKGGQYIDAPSEIKPTDFGAERIGEKTYLKLCDIDLWFPTKALFISSWEKLRTTVVAKQMQLDEDGFLRKSLAKYAGLMRDAPSELANAVRRAEADLIAELRTSTSP